MFDINDMAKAAFETVLFTPLQRAQKDGYINITGAEGKKKIEYITSEKHVENYEDPEEKVRAEFFAELIYKYEYPANRIKVEVVVPDRLPTDRADIVVFSDNDCKRPYAIVECKKEGVTDAEFNQAIEQGVGNATWVKLRAEYVVIIAGGTRRVLDVSDKYGAFEREQNIIADLPRAYGKPQEFRFYKGTDNDIKPVSREDLIAAIKNAIRPCGAVVVSLPLLLLVNFVSSFLLKLAMNRSLVKMVSLINFRSRPMNHHLNWQNVSMRFIMSKKLKTPKYSQNLSR